MVTDQEATKTPMYGSSMLNILKRQKGLPCRDPSCLIALRGGKDSHIGVHHVLRGDLDCAPLLLDSCK